jgi:diaminopimelate decarboxylase
LTPTVSASRLHDCLPFTPGCSRTAQCPTSTWAAGSASLTRPQTPPTPIRQLAARIADIVADECARLQIPLPAVAFEPGRWIIGPAGITLYSAGTTKAVDVAGASRLYVSVDGGMSDNARPALYGADYSVRIANRVSDADPALVRIAGKHCESGDIVCRRRLPPGDVAPGDLLAVAATGAYCWSLASNYNYLGRPAVVAVRDGESRVLVRGETIDDLLARDTGVVSTSSTTGDTTTNEQRNTGR